MSALQSLVIFGYPASVLATDAALSGDLRCTLYQPHPIDLATGSVWRHSPQLAPQLSRRVDPVICDVLYTSHTLDNQRALVGVAPQSFGQWFDGIRYWIRVAAQHPQLAPQLSRRVDQTYR